MNNPVTPTPTDLPEALKERAADVTESDVSYAKHQGYVEGWNECLSAVRAILSPTAPQADAVDKESLTAAQNQAGAESYPPITDSKGLTPELSAALQRGADGVFELLKDWHLINFDAKGNKRLWQIGRNLEGTFGCSLRGDYTAALRARGAVPCAHCDDTGDVHTPTGEWRGTCTCPAGQQEKARIDAVLAATPAAPMSAQNGNEHGCEDE